MQTVDNLIQASEHTKPVSVSPSSWQRLERKLDVKDRVLRIRQRYLTAAAIGFLLVLLAIPFMTNKSTYSLEELTVEKSPIFTKEDIAQLNTYLIVHRQYDLNG